MLQNSMQVGIFIKKYKYFSYKNKIVPQNQYMLLKNPQFKQNFVKTMFLLCLQKRYKYIYIFFILYKISCNIHIFSHLLSQNCDTKISHLKFYTRQLRLGLSRNRKSFVPQSHIFKNRRYLQNKKCQPSSPTLQNFLTYIVLTNPAINRIITIHDFDNLYQITQFANYYPIQTRSARKNNIYNSDI
eukprot:TRINITY_DN10487_c0_g1_i2.p2 TRINITY_DN10487_c0_g1~~TRINITY_DN10487_c0_g1_i2.p2  ORF type:complete len:186 (-),score=-26.56 TRINITY_DN10487_c0_g1_i2:16-573(-)